MPFQLQTDILEFLSWWWWWWWWWCGCMKSESMLHTSALQRGHENCSVGHAALQRVVAVASAPLLASGNPCSGAALWTGPAAGRFRAFAVTRPRPRRTAERNTTQTPRRRSPRLAHGSAPSRRKPRPRPRHSGETCRGQGHGHCRETCRGQGHDHGHAWSPRGPLLPHSPCKVETASILCFMKHGRKKD